MRITIDAIPPSLNKYAGRKNEWQYRTDKQMWKNLITLMMSATFGNKKESTEIEIKESKMNISGIVNSVHENAVQHGWWDDERSFSELIALCHSELSEALEEFRNGHKPDETYFNPDKPDKPEGIPTELADVIIRIFDMCGRYGIDIQKAIEDKHEYNCTGINMEKQKNG